jgi:DNA-binding XRE family transcriptional regulator
MRLHLSLIDGTLLQRRFNLSIFQLNLFYMQLKLHLRQLGKNIREARKGCGLKQVEVYEGCGLTYRHYQNIEAGKVNVTVGTLLRLSLLFKVSIRDLFEEVGN